MQESSDPNELKPEQGLNDEAFESLQTFSFVSPRVLGEHARKVRGVTDNHEERIAALEAKEFEDRLLAALSAAFENKLAGMMKNFQEQVFLRQSVNISIPFIPFFSSSDGCPCVAH